jgi:hypothetical protein
LGKTGGTQVGLLQREQLLLSRRSQSLSLQSQQLSLQTGELQQQSAELGQQQNFLQLQQSQRQINFQRAVAGFTAPGLTPEERRARIQEAELEADYAQKQLNFQKEQFKLQQDQIAINREQLGFQREAFALAQAQYQNQVALQDALSGRAYEDQLAAIAELQKAFATGVEIQALENLKVAITRQRDIFVEELNAQVQAEMDFIKAESQFAADLMAQTGRFATNLVSRVKQVFDDIRRQNGWFFGGSFGDTSGENATRNRIPEGTEPSGRYNAPGMLSMVSQPTQMTMGDAGGELVAVLRNPKPVLDFGSRQQATILAPIQINVTGNTVRNDSDLETLALQVSRLVEERMGRRMTTLGITVAR